MASSSKWTRARQWAGRPVAVTLRDAAELLHVDLEAIQAAAAALQPLVAADGTPNWSLRAPAAKLSHERPQPYRRRSRASWTRTDA